MTKQILSDSLSDALTELGLPSPESIELGRPANPAHGDWSSNLALLVCAAAEPGSLPPNLANPRSLAGTLAARLNANPPPHVRLIEAAGAGFLNFFLNETWLHEELQALLTAGEQGYARWNFGAGISVNVEFVSANPTGPLHVGGGRWAAYGDALCNILARCGYEVHREYYLNDRGRQMEAFAESLAARSRGEDPPEDGYLGEYITEWASEMPADAEVAKWGYARARRDIKSSLARLGVRFNTWFSERSLESDGSFTQTLSDLTKAGSTYEADGATWLRSSRNGDRQDRVLVRSGGEPTYLLGDLAYHRNKFSRGFDLLIDVWGADHHGYVDRLTAGICELGYRRDQLEIVLGQLVKVVDDGQETKISKRAGNLVLLDDLVEAIGADAARMTFLLQSLDRRQIIDLKVVTAESLENPVYYVQYAHARICSLLREATERGIERPPLKQAVISSLTSPRELALLRTLSELPDAVAGAARERAPHKLTTWVRRLAGDFHGFYHDCPVLCDSNELRGARLWLTEGARIGLVVALGLLGVSAPTSM